jgi:hypothetical protein
LLTLLVIVFWIWHRWHPKKEPPPPQLRFHHDYETPDSQQDMLEQLDFARWELGLEE